MANRALHHYSECRKFICGLSVYFRWNKSTQATHHNAGWFHASYSYVFSIGKDNSLPRAQKRCINDFGMAKNDYWYSTIKKSSFSKPLQENLMGQKTGEILKTYLSDFLERDRSRFVTPEVSQLHRVKGI